MTNIPLPLRRFVLERAASCCEYCLIPQESSLFTFEVDHIIAQKHRGKTIESNLCLSCFDCNRCKGSDFASFDPETDTVAMLFNPRQDRWVDHFRLDGPTIQPATPQCRVTVFLLQMNHAVRVTDRQVLINALRYPPVEFPVWR